MKFYYLFLLIPIVIIFSCKKDSNNNNSSKLSLEEQIKQFTEKELASGEQNDTVVLNFVFGMKKKEVYKHTKALYAADRKMYPIQKTKKVREYVYDLRLRKAGKLRTFFEAFYYSPNRKNEKLYKVECLPQIDTLKLVPSEVLDEIKMSFKDKYGDPHFVLPNKEDKDCKTYLWIDGNRKVELGCHEEKVFIYYIDIPVARKAAKDADL